MLRRSTRTAPGSSLGRLRQMQTELVVALVAGRPVPAGFQAEDLEVAQEALRSKRARAIMRGWPQLAQYPEYGASFSTYARHHPLPCDSAAADGRAFIRWLEGQRNAGEELPEAVRIEAFLFDLRYRTHRGRVKVRRAPTFGALWLGHGRFLFFVRLPFLRERLFRWR